jgi:hypothetical protein
MAFVAYAHLEFSHEGVLYITGTQTKVMKWS